MSESQSHRKDVEKVRNFSTTRGIRTPIYCVYTNTVVRKRKTENAKWFKIETVVGWMDFGKMDGSGFGWEISRMCGETEKNLSHNNILMINIIFHWMAHFFIEIWEITVFWNRYLKNSIVIHAELLATKVSNFGERIDRSNLNLRRYIRGQILL